MIIQNYFISQGKVSKRGNVYLQNVLFEVETEEDKKSTLKRQFMRVVHDIYVLLFVACFAYFTISQQKFLMKIHR